MSPPTIATIASEVQWSHTGVHLHAGKRYRFEVVPPTQTWFDRGIEYTAAGGTSFVQRFFKPFLRVKGDAQRRAEFFTLIGAVGETLEHAFVIGLGPREITAPVSGPLVCFANDCSFAYGNNRGSLRLTVTALD